MKSDLITIIKKEFARFFGDKRMVLTAILPGILIYVMYTFMGSGMSELQEVDEGYAYEINVVNLPQTHQIVRFTMKNTSSSEKGDNL